MLRMRALGRELSVDSLTEDLRELLQLPFSSVGNVPGIAERQMSVELFSGASTSVLGLRGGTVILPAVHGFYFTTTD